MTIEIKVKENDVLNINGVDFIFNKGTIGENKNIVFPMCFGLIDYRHCKGECIYKSKCDDISDQMEAFAKHVPSGYVKLKQAEPVPDCFGSEDQLDNRGCIPCTFNCTCVKAYCMIMEAKDNIPIPLPICFALDDYSTCSYKYDCNSSCSYKDICTKIYDRIVKAKNTVPKGYVKEGFTAPNCFSSHDPSKNPSCKPCRYRYSCKKAYDKIGSVTIKEVPIPVPNCFSTKPEVGCINCSYDKPCTASHNKIEETRKNFRIKVINDMQKGFNDAMTKVADTVSKNTKDPLETKVATSFCTCETSCTYKLHETQRDNSVS